MHKLFHLCHQLHLVLAYIHLLSSTNEEPPNLSSLISPNHLCFSWNFHSLVLIKPKLQKIFVEQELIGVMDWLLVLRNLSNIYTITMIVLWCLGMWNAESTMYSSSLVVVVPPVSCNVTFMKARTNFGRQKKLLGNICLWC